MLGAFKFFLVILIIWVLYVKFQGKYGTGKQAHVENGEPAIKQN